MKKQINFVAPKEEIEQFRLLCKAHGLNKSDMFSKMLREFNYQSTIKLPKNIRLPKNAKI